MATFFRDTFTGTAGAAISSRRPDVGGNWSQTAGGGSVILEGDGYAAHSTATTTTTAEYTATPSSIPSRQFHLKVIVKFPSTAPTEGQLDVYLYDFVTFKYYRLNMYCGTIYSPNVQLAVEVSHGTDFYFADSASGLAVGNEYEIDLTIDVRNIKAYLDTVEFASYTSSVDLAIPDTVILFSLYQEATRTNYVEVNEVLVDDDVTITAPIAYTMTAGAGSYSMTGHSALLSYSGEQQIGRFFRTWH